MYKMILISLLVITPRIYAQSTDTDAAAARILAANAAATQPAQITNRELNELRSELVLLRVENARLRAEIAKAKTTDANVKSVGMGNPGDDISKAMREHRIVNGMTIEQVNKALSVKCAKESDSSDGAVYVAVANWKQSPIVYGRGFNAGGDIAGTKYTIEVKDGVVVHWSSHHYREDAGSAGVIDRQ